MHREHIRAHPSWRRGQPRYDCAFISTNPRANGFLGLSVIRILLFFSFEYNSTLYPCALARWYLPIAESPDEKAGMWIVEPESRADGTPFITVIHLDCIVRASHLIPVYGTTGIPKDMKYYHALDTFSRFYVNKFIDHHAFEIAS